MSNKPFGCKHDGCELTFANDNELQVHQKRHEMVLNVGLANKNQAFADETPTPTRFIRNCEEVGLFQDLQNVNPFDETFKNAIGHSRNCTESPFISTNAVSVSDDTLHTPHIFPHIETKNSISNDINCTELESDRLIIIDSDDEVVDQIIVDVNQTTLKNIPKLEEKESGAIKKDSVEITRTITPDKLSLKDKLRERLQTRNNNQIKPNNSVTQKQNQSVVVQKQLRKRRCIMPMATNDSVVSSSTEPDGTETNDVCNDKHADRKLRNRVAQSRSRLRKKMHYEVLNGQMRVLQCGTDELRAENKALKKQIHELKKYILTHHEKCAFTADMVFLKKCLHNDELTHKIATKPTKKRTNPSEKPVQTLIDAVPLIKQPPKGNINYIVVNPPNT